MFRKLRAMSMLLSFMMCFVSPPARAEAVSILVGGAFGSSRGALLQQVPPRPAAERTVQVASLFIGEAGTSLFAARAEPQDRVGPTRGNATALEQVRQLISDAESRKHGYDAIQHGAKRLPPARPTQLTIAQIYQWIRDTPGQPHAIGRYQFIPATLRRLVNELGVSRDAVFSPRLQDRLADVLLADAGLAEFEAGQLGRQTFMNNLAAIWAGLPTSSGKSHYHGYAGNRASMTWARFDAEMRRIFPG